MKNWHRYKDFYLRGNYFITEPLLLLDKGVIPTVKDLILETKYSSDFDIFLCGSIVQGYTSYDMDIIASGNMDQEKFFIFSDMLLEKGLRKRMLLDIIYHPDISWIEGNTGVFRQYFSFNRVIHRKDNKDLVDRVYLTKKEGLLYYTESPIPTEKSLKRNYDLKKIIKI